MIVTVTELDENLQVIGTESRITVFEGGSGPAGADGADGAPGADGQDGADGAQGPPGNDGADGATGPTGATGATGATGPAGSTVASGVSFTPAGSVAATDVQAAIAELDTEKQSTGTAVLKTLYDANSLLIATTDDTPVALTVAASRIVGRKASGDIVALTGAEAGAIIGSGATSLDGLSDVDTTTVVPVAGSGLQWDGTNFVPTNGDGLTGANADDDNFSRNNVTTLPTGWSWDRQGASTFSERYGRGVLNIQSTASNYLRLIYRSLPAGFASATMKFSAMPGVGNEGPGLILREAATGKCALWGLRASAEVHLTFFATSSTTVGTDSAPANWAVGPLKDFYLRITRNSSTSWDFALGTEPASLTTHLAAFNVTTATQGFTPDQIGFGFLTLGTGDPKTMSVDYLKFT